LDQALRVRPHDERVLLAAGKEAALAGDVARAVQHWKRCFRADGGTGLQLVRLLAPQLPASFFLESFEPGLSQLHVLYRQYKQLHRTEDIDQLCRYYLQRAAEEAAGQDAPEAATTWLSASRICRDAGKVDASVCCAEKAFRLAPNNYDVRYALAIALIDAGRFDDAQAHFRWCLRRKPQQRKLRRWMQKSIRGSASRHRPRPLAYDGGRWSSNVRMS
jgi:tetratricopeptide (TPR) repeat protein